MHIQYINYRFKKKKLPSNADNLARNNVIILVVFISFHFEQELQVTPVVTRKCFYSWTLFFFYQVSSLFGWRSVFWIWIHFPPQRFHSLWCLNLRSCSSTLSNSCAEGKTLADGCRKTAPGDGCPVEKERCVDSQVSCGTSDKLFFKNVVV